MRAAVVHRTGEADVVALETNNETRKWLRDEVRGIRDTYRLRARELTKQVEER